MMIRATLALALMITLAVPALADEDANAIAAAKPPPHAVPALSGAPTIITRDQAADTLRFLGRVQLQGVEAPRFVALVQVLTVIAQAPPPAQ